MENENNIEIFYFSGTGNSARIAHWFASLAQQNGISAKINNISRIDENAIQTSNDSIIFLISPIHGFNYPPLMLDFLFRFPKGKNKIFLMNTRAGMKIGNWVTPGLSGIAFYLASLILFIKGYSISGWLPFDMPSNWVSLHPGLNDNTIRFIQDRMKLKVDKYFNKIISGKKIFHSLLEIIQDIAVAPIALGYYLMGRFILAKTFFAGSKCNSCNICIKNCPAKAIICKNGKPYWKLTCESCMKCMGNCPEKAIETGHGFLLLCILVNNLLVLEFAKPLRNILIRNFGKLLDEWFFQYLIFLVSISSAYFIFHYLKRYWLITKFMEYTSLTFFKFWGKKYKA